MADVADKLIDQGFKQAAQTGSELSGNFSKGISQGIQLAEHVERVQQARQTVEMQKQQLQMEKVGKLTSAMENGAKIKSKAARNAYFKNYIPKMAAAFGLQDFVPEDTMAMIQADPEQAKKFSLLKAKITNGQMTYDQAVSQMDPEAWAMLDDAEVTQLEAAEKFRVQQANTTDRANTVGARQTGQFNINQYQKVKDDFDASIKGTLDGLGAADSASKMLASGGPITAEAVKTQLARLTGEKGPLTDADIARFGGSRDLLSRAEQFLTKQTTGNLTPATRAEYKKIMTEFRSVLVQKVKDNEARAIESAQGLGLDGKRAKKVLAADRLTSAPGGTKETKAPDAWKETIKKAKAGFSAIKDPAMREKFLEGAATKYNTTVDKIKEALGE